MTRVNQTAVDPRIAVLIDQLDYAFDKAAWHGPNLASSLRGIDHRAAAVRRNGRKSIWEQALHAAYWKQRVVNKLIGTQKFPRRGSNWPMMPETPTARAWRDDVRLLHDIHANLRRAVEQLDPSQLEGKTIKLIIGAAAHDNYHTGQIRLLRRMPG
jgi:hypothetical protein